MTVHIPTFHEERLLIAQGLSLVAGVDEAGCGAWAGPVYAAAVILPLNSRLILIRDSKTLSEDQRKRMTDAIKIKAACWAIGVATHEEVDALNVRIASALAMRRAVETLTTKPDAVLSDAFFIPGLSMPCKNIIRGDAKIKSIAAASIIAKTERDACMKKLDEEFPGYGFADHKGYGTRKHQEALKKLGASTIHRKTYEPIRMLLKI